jgi:hypothetical protein
MIATHPSNPNQQVNICCKTCDHWADKGVSVCRTKVMAYCSELQCDTMAGEFCASWSHDGKKQSPVSLPKLILAEDRTSKQYNSWEQQEWICEECGVKFMARPSNQNGKSMPRRFCGDPCYRKWQKRNPINKGCFRPGQRPWNTGVKGTHFSPATEFKPGNVSHNKLPIGTVLIRKQGSDSTRKQAYVKVAEPNKWKARALINREAENGPLPKGMLLWHTDGDSLNDDISNLEAITRAESLARTRKRLQESGQLKKVAKKIWSTRRERYADLQQKSVAELRQLGYRYYCPVCYQPYKEARLTCHKTAEAKVL